MRAAEFKVQPFGHKLSAKTKKFTCFLVLDRYFAQKNCFECFVDVENIDWGSDLMLERLISTQNPRILTNLCHIFLPKPKF